MSKFTLVHENELSKNLESDLNILQKYKHKNVLLMYDSNPVWDFEEYFLELAEHTDNVFLSSANMLNLWGSHPKIVYLPTFYFSQVQHKNFQTENKNYRFSYLSNKARFHRIYFFHRVKEHMIEEDVFKVSNDAFRRDWWKQKYNFEMKKWLGKEDKTIEESIPYESENSILCNQQLNTFDDLTNDHSNRHIAYDSCFNITGETDIEKGYVFVTEKTWKAVRSSVIPIFLESSDTFDSLSELGFNFENEINIKTDFMSKINHIEECMVKYTLEDSIKYHRSHMSVIKINMSRFYDDKLKNIFVSHIKDKLKL